MADWPKVQFSSYEDMLRRTTIFRARTRIHYQEYGVEMSLGGWEYKYVPDPDAWTKGVLREKIERHFRDKGLIQ